MPKIKKLATLFKSWIDKYNEKVEVFKTDDVVLFCNACSKAITAERKFFVDAHCNSGKFFFV